MNKPDSDEDSIEEEIEGKFGHGNKRKRVQNNPDSDSIEILKKLPQKNKPPLIPSAKSPISSMIFKEANQDAYQLKVETMTGF